jgi:hypothetical protein
VPQLLNHQPKIINSIQGSTAASRLGAQVAELWYLLKHIIAPWTAAHIHSHIIENRSKEWIHTIQRAGQNLCLVVFGSAPAYLEGLSRAANGERRLDTEYGESTVATQDAAEAINAGNRTKAVGAQNTEQNVDTQDRAHPIDRQNAAGRVSR